MSAARRRSEPAPSSSSASTSVKSRLDVTRALAILGFSSTHTLDHNSGQELNDALAKQMQLIDSPKPAVGVVRRAAHRRGGGGGSDFSSSSPVQGGKMARYDRVRILHEAYQFLSRKFVMAPPASGNEDEEEVEEDEEKDWRAMKEAAAVRIKEKEQKGSNK